LNATLIQKTNNVNDIGKVEIPNIAPKYGNSHPARARKLNI